MEQTDWVISTQGFSDVQDLTPKLEEFLQTVEKSEGLLNVMVPGSTAGITTIEFEPGCVSDLQRALEEIAPEDRSYKHNEKWGDGNGFSHLRAALLGPDVTVPFRDGELQTGTWQQIVVVDCDNRPRDRRVRVSVL